LTYRRFRDDDSDALAAATALAFGFPVDDTRKWWDTAGRDHLRVWDDGQLRGGLLDIPMGMFVGGRTVPLHGVAGVVVTPESRGRGIGRRMMSAYLEELHSQGVPLSALYASTRSLYRAVGYELAGGYHRATLATRVLREAGQALLGWEPLSKEGRAEVVGAYRALTRHRTGHLDRGPYVWARVWSHRGQPNHAWVLRGTEGVRAWVVVRQERADDDWLHLVVVDHGAADAEALSAVSSFLGGFASMARTTQLHGGPHVPLLDRLPENDARIGLHEPWMLRVVDVEAALAARGWPTGWQEELSLRIDDPVLPTNAGPWVVRIQGGQAVVRRGGSGEVALHIRALAALFTGYHHPVALRDQGLLQGAGEALASLAAAFAGPAPGMPDFF